jgi:hypothetical protein
MRSRKVVTLGTAERVRPVPTLLYAMAGRQALVSNAASRCRRFAAAGCRTIAIYEYTPFCNGPGDVKSRDRHAAELTLLSVVGAEAATLCCQKER